MVLKAPHFDGDTYDPELDHLRLTTQLDRVRDLLLRHSPIWLTLSQVSAMLAEPEASVSARIRDLRKAKFGGFEVQARRQPTFGRRGIWEYRIMRPDTPGQREMFDGLTKVRRCSTR